MKTLCLTSLLAGLIAVANASAQTNPSQDNGEIAVLDVAKVFKSNPAFNKEIERIQAEAQKLKADVEGKQQQLRARAQEINDSLKANTEDRRKAELELEQEMTSLRTFARQSEADLMSQEAKLYYDTYLQMQQIVTHAAQSNGIAMVLRFDSSEIDPTIRGSVVSGVNRAIVYQRDRDLTGYVIEQMNALPAGSSANSGAKTNR